MKTNRIDSAVFDDKDYDSDHLSWAEQSGDSSVGCNYSGASETTSDNNDDDSTSSHDYSDDDGSDDMEVEQSLFKTGLAGVRRRLSRRHEAEHPDDSHDSSNDDGDGDDTDNSKEHRPARLEPIYFHLYQGRFSRLHFNRSSIVLFLCFMLWVYVKIMTIDGLPDERMAMRQNVYLTPDQRFRLRKQAARLALGAAAGASNDGARKRLLSWMNGGDKRRGGRRKTKVVDNKETMPPGCIPSDWHKFSFPTCNSLHEIDLGEELWGNSSAKSRYVGSGLWRDVFKVTDTFGTSGVLKVMKGEHDLDSRNFDRHRRDALVMERLTSSPHVVSLYGFCGNTVLTEHIGKALDLVILSNATRYPSRNFPRHRLKLALGVVRSIQVLHEIEGGPIVHTDIQSDQFLVTDSGKVKVNDFNRCRFVSHRNITGDACPFRIPTSPGANRSPEEYEYSGLSEKLDVYSTSNVLYEILTGHQVWEGERVSKIKIQVMKGEKPPIPPEYLLPGTTDAGLAALISRGHERSPEQRISASDMVEELENLLQVHAQVQS